MAFGLDTGPDNVVTIKVIGVGGGGNNVVNRMVKSGTKGVDFIAVNTDKQALAISSATFKIQIGEKLTGGQGAGSDPEVGRKSAEESRSAVSKALELSLIHISIGSGGLLGLGLGKSRQKFLYLPEPENDFIFAIVCEELGLIGAGIVLILFALLVMRGYWIAIHARDRFGALLVVGITTQMCIRDSSFWGGRCADWPSPWIFPWCSSWWASSTSWRPCPTFSRWATSS